MPYLITITGPSRSGKSTALDILKEIVEGDSTGDLKIFKVQKYTTRSFRAGEIRAIELHEDIKNDVLPVIGTDNSVEGIDSEAEANQIRLQAFKRIGCDLVYEQYGHRYGLKIDDLFKLIRNGYTPVVVINDVRAIEDLKKIFGHSCISLFIFREVPSMDDYVFAGEERDENDDEIQTRFDKATAIYRMYIENIHLFDRLILNVHTDMRRSLTKLIDQLASSLVNRKRRISTEEK